MIFQPPASERGRMRLLSRSNSRPFVPGDHQLAIESGARRKALRSGHHLGEQVAEVFLLAALQDHGFVAEHQTPEAVPLRFVEQAGGVGDLVTDGLGQHRRDHVRLHRV